MVMSAGIKGAWREGPCCQETMPFAYLCYPLYINIRLGFPGGRAEWVGPMQMGSVNGVDVDRGSMVVTR